MKENGKLFHKYSEARSWVHSSLLQLPPGGALPGLREMVKRTGVGRTILEKVLAEAEENHFLERRSRSGYYRCEGGNSAHADLAVLLDNSNGQLDMVGAYPQRASYMSRIIQHLQQLAKLHEKKLFITDKEEDLPEYLPLFIAGSRKAALKSLMGKHSGRTVTISGEYSSELHVMPPKERNIRSGMSYLYKTGHRKIGVFFNRLSDLPKTEEKNDYLFEYYKFNAEHALKTYPHFLFAYPGETEIAQQLAEALQHEIKPDALLVPYCWLSAVYRALEQEKMSVPWHISVLAIGTPGDDFFMGPTPTMIFDQPEKVAESAWQLMFSDSRKAYIQLEPEIISGNTVKRRELNY